MSAKSIISKIASKKFWTSAVSGVVSAGLLFGIAELIAAYVDPFSSPVQALGSSVIDLVPPGLKDFAIENFGTNDKLVLLLSIGVFSVVASAIIGVIALKKIIVGLSLVSVLGVVMIVAALTRPNADILFAVPSVVGLAAGLFLLYYLSKNNPYSKKVSHG